MRYNKHIKRNRKQIHRPLFLDFLHLQFTEKTGNNISSFAFNSFV